jgi:NarL family two-component system sensor histidine kinase LiaS
VQHDHPCLKLLRLHKYNLLPFSQYQVENREEAFPNLPRSLYNTLMSDRGTYTNRFRNLRWKLTLTYTGVTIGALLTVELILLAVLGVGVVVLVNSGFLPTQLIEAASADYAPVLRFYLAQTPPDQEGINQWLQLVGAMYSTTLPLSFEPTDEMLVVDGDGRLLAVKPPNLLGNAQIGEPLESRSIPGLAAPLQAALAGIEDPELLYTLLPADQKVVLALPVWNETHGQVLGVLVAIGKLPTLLTQLGEILPILGVSLLFFTLIAGLAGTVYGFLVARGPVQRLNQLSEATLAWSGGDFSVLVDDPSGDELGQLADRLNEMAQQLQELFDTRQELAVSEERNRLARDLHDSAKQQAFAAAAQISAAHKLLKHDPSQAEAHIEEAERLIKDLRRELTNLIQQLRPVALEDKGLAAAVKEYTEDWSRQNGITAEVRVQRGRPMSLEIEQTVFRIVQEALANVARHSQASHVEVELVYSKTEIACSVSDDGIGFDPGEVNSGLGLRSMQDRADTQGGNLSLESVPGEGTSVSLLIPLHGSIGSGQEKPHE